MDSILHPSRITTLEPQTVRIVEHRSPTEQHTIELKNVYPFETIYSIKQRIALIHEGDKTWLPSQLFVAAESSGLYKPLEFVWPFASTFKDPFDPSVKNKLDSRIYEDGARKPVFPRMHTGITLEHAVQPVAAGAGAGKGIRTLHVWSLATVATAAGYGNAIPVPQEIFEGYFSLYFPRITNRDVLMQAFSPASKGDEEAYEALRLFRNRTEERYNKLESGLAILQGSATLTELRNVQYNFVKQAQYTGGMLERLFYETQPSDILPFIRFFPANERVPPIVKVATTASGASKIADTKTLDQYLADQPTTETGGVLVIKSPIVSRRAAPGLCWTFRIFETGDASISLTATAADKAILASVAQDAYKQLPDILGASPLASLQYTLAELTAVYEFTSSLEKKPTKRELAERMDPFAPLFGADVILPGDSASLSLRYKAVSNFVADRDPIMNYLTALFMRTSESSMDSAPIDAFSGALIQEFGMVPEDAKQAVKFWIDRHAEYVVQDGDKYVPSKNLGVSISVYNNHPKYLFLLAGAESMKDVERIVSLLMLLASQPSEVLRVGGPTTAASAAVEEPPAAQEAMQDLAAFDGLMDMAALGFNAPDVTDADLTDMVQETAPAPSEDLIIPTMLRPDEVIPPIADEWYVNRLKDRDVELFKYSDTGGDARVKLYTRTCQRNAHRQPNVLSPEAYKRARALYGDSVFWLETPLSPADWQAVRFAYKSPGERKKLVKDKTEQYNLEKRALQLGFPLGNDTSLQSGTPAQKEEIAELMKLQTTKPLWIMVRAGTRNDAPNYYMCAEYWCVRDDLPLIPNEFLGNKRRDTSPKESESCPFCGGKLILNTSAPEMGMTVLQRQPMGKGKGVAKYAGYVSNLYHPDSFALPCCFTDPDNLVPPDGAKPLPSPLVPLPPLQQTDEDAPPAPLPVAPAAAATVAVDRENRDRPFAPSVKRGTGQNKWFIANQNILGRIQNDWFELEKGAVAVPPRAVNDLFGQSPESFLTKKYGALGEKINSYLTTPAAAIVRYGLGASKREPGTNMISLLAYAQYATAHAQGMDDAIPSNEAVIENMCVTQEFRMIHAFEQANYGTLMHEFSLPGQTIGSEGEFTAWCGRNVIQMGTQRVYAEQLYLAWNNFCAYVKDKKDHKEFRIWESLFATPGLLTSTGFHIVRIQLNKSGEPTIVCPEFGVSLADQQSKPPLLFVLEDMVTGSFDPLVLYDGVNKDERRVAGVLETETPAFDALRPIVREPIAAFITQYYSSSAGCARSASPIHPWILERSTDKVPRLGPFIARVAEKDMELRNEGLLRDRSNRLVGVRVKRAPFGTSPEFFIPVVDDGSLHPLLTSVRDESALPHPPLKALLELLTGAQKAIPPKRLAAVFPGLLPKTLQATTTEYVALELECGAIVPFEPFSRSSDVAHRRFVELAKGTVITHIKEDFPWDTNLALLGPAPADGESLETTPEEVLDESYQYLRIRFSNWLNTTARGQEVKKQIELLRRARHRLPLYELQKRLEVLLTPVIQNNSEPWLTTEGRSYPSILRRDCAQIQTEDGCSGGCTWTEGRCLIHTTSTPRFVNPIQVLTVRLVDELLRTFSAAEELLKQKVPYLRPITSRDFIQEKDAVLFTAKGRGDEALYEKLGYARRQPSEFTMGFTFPEEIRIPDDVAVGYLPTEWTFYLRQAIVGATASRDKRDTLFTVLLSLADTQLMAYEAERGRPITGTEEDWAFLAKKLETEVILTQYNAITKTIAPVKWLQGQTAAGAAAPPRRFIILDAEGIPLQRIKDGGFVSLQQELPGLIQAWLDTNMPQ